MNLHPIDVRFPLYAIGGMDFWRLGSLESIETTFEIQDLSSSGGVELYDALYRAVRVEDVSRWGTRKPLYELHLDTMENADWSALWFRHSLIQICLLRRELGLADAVIFKMDCTALVAAICARLGLPSEDESASS